MVTLPPGSSGEGTAGHTRTAATLPPSPMAERALAEKGGAAERTDTTREGRERHVGDAVKDDDGATRAEDGADDDEIGHASRGGRGRDARGAGVNQWRVGFFPLHTRSVKGGS